jgi:hypothetical protein
MAQGIYEQLAWLTTRVKRLCCKVDTILNGGGELRPYKVYTALLTQSGGDDFDSIAAGNTTIGITYQINGSIAGDDFRNIGGPLITTNGEFQGTYFVATGTTPTNWSGNTVLIYNTGAPVVTVLENTIGNIWFEYEATGIYRVRSNSAFTLNKTAAFISGQAIGVGVGVVTTTFTTGIAQVKIMTQNTSGGVNNYLIDTPIEIRVYN